MCGASFERYLSLIRLIAANFNAIGTNIRNKMKTARWFLGSTRSVEEGGEDGEAVYKYQLLRPSECLIIDDASSLMIFASSILGCPQETSIESVAETLGAKRLSKLVSEDYRIVGEPGESSKSIELQNSE